MLLPVEMKNTNIKNGSNENVHLYRSPRFEPMVGLPPTYSVGWPG